jgi:hypothetical protein
MDIITTPLTNVTIINIYFTGIPVYFTGIPVYFTGIPVINK